EELEAEIEYRDLQDQLIFDTSNLETERMGALWDRLSDEARKNLSTRTTKLVMLRLKLSGSV
ncbi:MAG: hypothetical protein WCQ50_21335, partial [Spirochaetota bacterium]